MKSVPVISAMRWSLRGSRTLALGIPLMRAAAAAATMQGMLDIATSVTVIHGAMLSFETVEGRDADAAPRPRPRAARDAAAGDRRHGDARARRLAADADARGRGADRGRASRTGSGTPGPATRGSCRSSAGPPKHRCGSGGSPRCAPSSSRRSRVTAPTRAGMRADRQARVEVRPPDGDLRVGAVQVAPRQRGGEQVAGAGGVDHRLAAAVDLHRAPVVHGHRAVGPERHGRDLGDRVELAGGLLRVRRRRSGCRPRAG